ncbi:MAG: type I-C CRISPR-associated protein Cas8c/Csd1 [Lachnospiraceae bacterium]|nr:type I-C CRISPR-associated protein Cas8c/Csd1 [Lachnospiraceae bacterium]
MILKALTEYYEALVKQGEVAEEGWSQAKVSYAITIDKDGKVRNVQSLLNEVESGKKKVLVPTQKTVPLQKGRQGPSSGKSPYFLCDSAKFLLGAWLPSGNEEKDLKEAKSARDYFAEACKLHKNILARVEDEQAQKLCRFFSSWDFEKDKNCLNVSVDSLLGANLVFRDYEKSEDDFLENAKIRAAWLAWMERENVEISQGRCLVTGKHTTIARLHPQIRGIRDAQPSGAALVSFNSASLESYGKSQGDNAPVSEYVANAYGKALSYLIMQRECHQQIGNTTVVYWSGTGESAYSECMSNLLGMFEETDEDKLQEIMASIAQGKKSRYRETDLNPNAEFYILGISPNAARLSVRFFYAGTFGRFVSNLVEHYKRLEIQKQDSATKPPSVYQLLRETVNQKSSKKEIQPILVGKMMDAVLNNTMYPENVYTSLMLRMRADKEVRNWRRTAFIKAYLIKNKPQWKGVVDTMKLNEETDCAAYLLGRLFAVLEEVQETASPGVNTTVKDKYFNSACATPASVFPILLKLSNAHMRTLKRDKRGLAITIEKKLEGILDKVRNSFPSTMTLEEQGIFILGYYHQHQKRFETNKEDK